MTYQLARIVVITQGRHDKPHVIRKLGIATATYQFDKSDGKLSIIKERSDPYFHDNDIAYYRCLMKLNKYWREGSFPNQGGYYI